jgi:histone-binding protein RBBP4
MEPYDDAVVEEHEEQEEERTEEKIINEGILDLPR